MIKKTTTLLLILLLSGCFASDENRTKPKTTPTKETVPTQTTQSLFSLKTIQGETLHLNELKEGFQFQEFKDKAVLFVFFGYKCPPCLREIPELIALQNKNYPDLEIVAMEVQGLSEDQLQAFAKKKGMNYHLIAGESHRAFIDYIIQRANWRGSIPFLLGFDKSGTVQIVHIGGVTQSQFQKIYTALTQSKTSSSDQNNSKK